MRYLPIIVGLLFAAIARGQTDSLAWYFDGDEVVLEFDKRFLEKQGEKAFDRFFEAEGFDPLALIDTKRKRYRKWLLHQIGEYRYQLRKQLSEFSQSLSWSDKYKIDGSKWLSPTSQLAVSPSDEKVAPSAESVRISSTGNVDFSLKGFQEAERVILTGSFANWDKQAYRMKRNSSGWFLTLEMPPGIYEYKFIADGEWLHDPQNPNAVLNEYHTINSVLLVGESVSFFLPGYATADEIMLSGSFNNWSESAFPMQKTEDGWYYELPLPAGKHFYKFIVDGAWINDPGNDLMESDGKGHWNSILLVQ